MRTASDWQAPSGSTIADMAMEIERERRAAEGAERMQQLGVLREARRQMAAARVRGRQNRIAALRRRQAE